MGHKVTLGSMIFKKTICLLSVGLLLILMVLESSAEPGQNAFFQLLKAEWGISEKNLSTLKDNIIVEELPVSNSSREIAVFAIMRMEVPKAFVIKQLYAHDSMMFSENSNQYGVFGNPPSPHDMVSFQFPKSDLEVMRGCEVGKCKIKLPGDVIEALGKLDWSSKESTDKINRLFRNDIAAYAERYLARGRYGLVTYADKKEPLPLTYGFEQILEQSSYLGKYVPKLYHYLINFPENSLDNAESYLYWSLTEFGLRPVTEITHATVYNPPTLGATLVTENQIYASHYFGARFKFSVVINAREDAETPGVFLICLDHSFFDKHLSRMNREILSLSVRKKFQSKLRTIRSQLETKFKPL